MFSPTKSYFASSDFLARPRVILHETILFEAKRRYNFSRRILGCKKTTHDNENGKFRRVKYALQFSRYDNFVWNFRIACNLSKKTCNSASFFSGCVQGDKSKCIIALPTDAEQLKAFKNLLQEVSVVPIRTWHLITKKSKGPIVINV